MYKLSRYEIAALVVILIGAAWLRFGYAGVNSFAFDEARLSLISLRMARGGEFASVGMPSSAGVPNMPAAAWLFALPYALSPNPMVATWFVSALSLAAVIGIWGLARQWGTRAGWVAGLFLAVNPYAVLYGRSVWAQNLLIPFAVAWLWAVILSVESDRKRLAIGAAVFLTGFIVQVHFAGAALVLAGAYVFFRWQWWRYPLAVMVGCGLTILCALPFMLTDGAIQGLLDTAGGESQIDLIAWRDVLRLAVGADWSYLLHGEAELPLMRAGSNIIMGGLGAMLFLFVGMLGVFGAAAAFGVEDNTPPKESSSVGATRRVAPTTDKVMREIALILLVAPPLFFTWHSTPVFIHYLLSTLPAVALLLAWLVHDGQNKWLRNGVTALVFIAAVGWCGQLVRGFPYTAVNFTPNGMATPLGTLQHAANSVEPPLLYFTHGDNPNVDGEPAIFSALWWGRENVRIVDGRSVLILPSYPATMIFTERPFQAWEEMRESDLFVDLTEIPRREGVEPWQVTAYDGESAPAGFQMLDVPVEFAHGGTLLGWRTYTIGGRTRVSTLWQSNGAIGENVQQFHHLRTPDTPDGEPFMVSDVSVRGHKWQDGDTVIVMGDFFDLQPDVEYTVQVGHYTLPDVTRIPHESSDIVELGVFTLSP